MTNNAYHRLCNEWRFNAFNTALSDYLESIGKDYDEFFSNTDLMKEARAVLKKSGIWLEDSNEVDIYIELMPFGGYTDYSQIKAAINEYRSNGRSNKAHHKFCS